MRRRMADQVQLVARDAAGCVVCERSLSSAEWYDGDCPIIDSDAERVRLGIRSIEGSQFDRGGRLFRRWIVTYRVDGSVEDDEVLLDDWEPAQLPTPEPGQSAYDQLRTMGILPLRKEASDLRPD